MRDVRGREGGHGAFVERGRLNLGGNFFASKSKGEELLGAR